MKKFLVVSTLFLLCACEGMSTDPNPEKSNRSFSNIDKVRHGKTYKKTTPKHGSQSIKSGSDTLAKSDLDGFYDNSQNDEGAAGPEESSVNRPYSGIFKIGNPYEVQGVSYYPQNYEEYEEVGMASWYGADFHGKPTANGETYNSYTMTAAHRTLPLPSMVRVTNLNNGKSAIVRVNDRGPFAKNRVIDVSEKAAEELGFKDKGTANVRVQLLRNDTDELLKRLQIKN